MLLQFQTVAIIQMKTTGLFKTQTQTIAGILRPALSHDINLGKKHDHTSYSSCASQHARAFGARPSFACLPNLAKKSSYDNLIEVTLLLIHNHPFPGHSHRKQEWQPLQVYQLSSIKVSYLCLRTEFFLKDVLIKWQKTKNKPMKAIQTRFRKPTNDRW